LSCSIQFDTIIVREAKLTRVKVCGITNLEDAWVATEAGADALGFVFVPNTPRYIEPDHANTIMRQIPPLVTTIGLFVDVDGAHIQNVATNCRLDAIQLHGNEPPEFCHSLDLRVIKAFRVKGNETLDILPKFQVDAYLLDAYVKGKLGGTGETFDWNLACHAKRYGQIILAGGLNPSNVSTAISQVKPYAVDVSSGVEVEPGRKDPEKVRDFIRTVRETDLS
jgi:phosphoribosylanthranilate isomerase